MKTTTQTALQLVAQLENWNSNQPVIKARLINIYLGTKKDEALEDFKFYEKERKK